MNKPWTKQEHEKALTELYFQYKFPSIRALLGRNWVIEEWEEGDYMREAIVADSTYLNADVY